MHLDLLFPLQGESLPVDHAYPLYAALSGIVPEFHQAEAGLRFAPIGGEPLAPRLLRLTPHSRLRVRVPDASIRLVMPLAGRRLEIAGSSVRLGVPSVMPLEPAATLFTRLATFKNSREPDRFLDRVRHELALLNIAGEPSIPLVQSGPHAGEPRRRVLRVKGLAIVGYSLVITGLSATDSLKLQEQGLGGRTKMACGFFLPAKEVR